MRALTFATDDDGYYPLARSSALRFDFELENVGSGESWSGMASKMIRYRERLRRYRPEEVVMLVDAYDVFFDGPANEAKLIFQSMGLPYLFSGQRYFPTSRFWRRASDRVMGLDGETRFCREIESDRYSRPCMGALMGFADPLTQLFSRLIEIEARRHTNDDQKLLNLYLQEHPEEAHVDRGCRIFQNLWRTRGVGIAGRFDSRDLDADVRVLPTGRLENRFTGTHPQVVHAPMNLDIDPLLAEIGYRLDSVRRVSSLRYIHYGVLPKVRTLFEGKGSTQNEQHVLHHL